MTKELILAALDATPAWKLQQLFALGVDGPEAAALVGVDGEFARGVYADWDASTDLTPLPAYKRR